MAYGRLAAGGFETDPEILADLIVGSWAPDGRNVGDPLIEASGYNALTAAIAATQQQFPGWVFIPVGNVDTHHNLTRSAWGLGPAGAEPVVIGSDVVMTGADGRICHVVGFLDKVPDTTAARATPVPGLCVGCRA